MALRIALTQWSLNPNNGNVDLSIVYRDTVTGRANSLQIGIVDPGGSSASLRNAIEQAAVDACNHDNDVGGASTTNASATDILISCG